MKKRKTIAKIGAQRYQLWRKKLLATPQKQKLYEDVASEKELWISYQLPDHLTIKYLEMKQSPYVAEQYLALVVEKNKENSGVYAVGKGDDPEVARKEAIQNYWKTIP